MIEISLSDLIKLIKFASVGKLMNGMIHNLNGPLQNLGMDMEMIVFSIDEKGQLDNALMDDIKLRLKRMDEEFEHLNCLIRAAAYQTNLDDDTQESMSLNDFLEGEIFFLNTNLYFKHYVQTELQLEKDLPPLKNLPEGFGLAISCFMRVIVEEFEKQGIKSWRLEAGLSGSSLKIVFNIEGGELSKKFLEILDIEEPVSRSLKIESGHIGIEPALMILKSGGVSVSKHFKTSGSQITLAINV